MRWMGVRLALLAHCCICQTWNSALRGISNHVKLEKSDFRGKMECTIGVSEYANTITPPLLHHQYGIPWVREKRPLFHTLLQQLLDAGKLLELFSLWIYKKYDTFQHLTYLVWREHGPPRIKDIYPKLIVAKCSPFSLKNYHKRLQKTEILETSS